MVVAMAPTGRWLRCAGSSLATNVSSVDGNFDWNSQHGRDLVVVAGM